MLSPRNIRCEYCGPLMWIEEKLKNSSKKKPKFGICCLQGSIDLPKTIPIHNELKDILVSDKEFRTSIRLYNSILGFTSVAANVDEELMKAKVGVYNYRINGGIHHKLSHFEPKNDTQANFSQIYIYDSQMQASIRAGMFPRVIKADILNKIQSLLLSHNPYVNVYQQAGEMLRKDPSLELNIVLKNNTSKDKTLNKPTSDEIAVLMVEDNLEGISKRDVVVTRKASDNQYPHMFINENMSFYDPLGYILMHVNGESGWQYKTYLKNKRKNHLIEQHFSTQPINNFNDLTTYPRINCDEELISSNMPIDFYDYLDIIENNDADSIADEVSPYIETKSKYVTAREYYSYKLQDRPS
jgi:hypothetical protein